MKQRGKRESTIFFNQVKITTPILWILQSFIQLQENIAPLCSIRYRYLRNVFKCLSCYRYNSSISYVHYLLRIPSSSTSQVHLLLILHQYFTSSLLATCILVVFQIFKWYLQCSDKWYLQSSSVSHVQYLQFKQCFIFSSDTDTPVIFQMFITCYQFPSSILAGYHMLLIPQKNITCSSFATDTPVIYYIFM